MARRKSASPRCWWLLEPTPDKRKVALFFFCRAAAISGRWTYCFPDKTDGQFPGPRWRGGGQTPMELSSLDGSRGRESNLGYAPTRARRRKTASFVVVLCWCCCCCCCRYSGLLPWVVKTCCCWLVVIYIFLDECVPLSFFSLYALAPLSLLLLLLYFCTFYNVVLSCRIYLCNMLSNFKSSKTMQKGRRNEFCLHFAVTVIRTTSICYCLHFKLKKVITQETSKF